MHTEETLEVFRPDFIKNRHLVVLVQMTVYCKLASMLHLINSGVLSLLLLVCPLLLFIGSISLFGSKELSPTEPVEIMQF